MTVERAGSAIAVPARDRALHALALATEGRAREAIAEADGAVALAPSAPCVHLARSAVLR